MFAHRHRIRIFHRAHQVKTISTILAKIFINGHAIILGKSIYKILPRFFGKKPISFENQPYFAESIIGGMDEHGRQAAGSDRGGETIGGSRDPKTKR
jgi:hypothetical protein